MKAVYSPDLAVLRNLGETTLSFAARDLALLNAIDKTLDALSSGTCFFDSWAGFAEELAVRIRKFAQARPIDPDDSLERLFSACEDVLVEYCGQLEKKRQACRDDQRLAPEDGIDEAHGALILAVERLCHAFDVLREAIGIHDGLLSPSAGSPSADMNQVFQGLMR
jgi:hypothetical protein